MFLNHSIWTSNWGAYISGQNRDKKVSETEHKSNADRDEENQIGKHDENNMQDKTHKEELDTGRNKHRIILKQRWDFSKYSG